MKSSGNFKIVVFQIEARNWNELNNLKARKNAPNIFQVVQQAFENVIQWPQNAIVSEY